MRIIDLDDLDKVEQQIQVIRFVSESLIRFKGLDEFFVTGCQATLENVSDTLQSIVDKNNKEQES